MSIEITKVYKEHFPALRFIGTCYTNEDRDSAGSFGKQWDEWMNNDSQVSRTPAIPVNDKTRNTLGW